MKIISFSSGYSVKDSTVQTERIVLDPETGQLGLSVNDEVPRIQRKPLQQSVSLDDFYLHNPRLIQSPGKPIILETDVLKRFISIK